MLDFIKIDPMKYPLKKDESWWVTPPNSKGEFIVPSGACTACLEDFLNYTKGTLYRVFLSQQEGWVCVASTKNVVELPQYLFARYFDAEVFVRHLATPREIDTLISSGKYVEGKWED